MNRAIRFRGIIRDDAAQALTEFAIVIPVVLLFFFAMLQYFEIVRVGQLGNYAAFQAARVYAVRAAVEGDEQARKTAINAAALALAPVAHFVPGELAGSSASLTPHRRGLLALGEGFIVARLFRLNPKLGGGSISITTSGNPKQVDVAINYPQPIYVPGLAELWGLTAGRDSIHKDLRPLSEDLGGLPGIAYRVDRSVTDALPGWFREYFSGATESIVEMAVSPVESARRRIFPFPYVNVRSKCSLGYEDWGHKTEYRPRLPNTAKGGESEDLELEQQAKDMAEKARKTKEAQAEAKVICDQAFAASNSWFQAEARFNRTPLQPKAQYDQARAERDSAKISYDAKKAQCRDAMDRVVELGRNQ